MFGGPYAFIRQFVGATTIVSSIAGGRPCVAVILVHQAPTSNARSYSRRRCEDNLRITRQVDLAEKEYTLQASVVDTKAAPELSTTL